MLNELTSLALLPCSARVLLANALNILQVTPRPYGLSRECGQGWDRGEQKWRTHPYDTLVFSSTLSWAWVGPPRRALAVCLTAWETTCTLCTFPGRGKGNCGLTRVRNTAAWCPDIIASTQSDSWMQAHLPSMAREVEGEDMGRGVRQCEMKYVVKTCNVTRH